MSSIKRVFSLIIILAVVLSTVVVSTLVSNSVGNAWDGSVASSFAGGDGSEESPYIISNASELAYLAKIVNGGEWTKGKHYKLISDIVLNDTENYALWGSDDGQGGIVAPKNKWVPIGCHDGYPFLGYFDGGGHTVYGMYVERSDEYRNYYGLFGSAYLYGEVTVKGLSVADSVIYAFGAENVYDLCVGGIAGYANTLNCSFSGIINADRYYADNLYAGGIVGKGDATGCVARGSLTTDSTTGYGAGITAEGTAKGCVSYLDVSAEYAAGIVSRGYAEDCINHGNTVGFYSASGVVYSGYALRCGNTGSITAKFGDAAGVVLYDASVNGNLTDQCFNSGDITAVDCETVSGIIGNGAAKNSFNSGKITATGCEYVGGISARPCYNTSYGFENCYNAGAVIAQDCSIAGAAMGDTAFSPMAIGCYYLNTVGLGDSLAVGLNGEQMQTEQAFSGFEFGRVWEFTANSDYLYPNLIWNGSKSYTCTAKFIDSGKTVKTQKVAENGYLTLPKLESKNGLENTGWYMGESLLNCGDSLLMDADYTFVALWEAENTGALTWDGGVASSFAGGDGSEESPYVISNASELAYLAQSVKGGEQYFDTYFKITSDIYLNDKRDDYSFLVTAQNQWEPINYFGGYLDGDGHSIYGLYVNGAHTFKGLFGESHCYIKNLNIENSFIGATVNSQSLGTELSLGAFVAKSYGSIENCQTNATVQVTVTAYCEEYQSLYLNLGGIAGEIDYAVNCQSNGRVCVTALYGDIGSLTLNGNMGGVTASGITLKDCVNDGTVTVNNLIAKNSISLNQAGVAGYANTVTGCVNNGEVYCCNFSLPEAASSGSGVAGVVYFASTVEDCVNNGKLTAFDRVSGVVQDAHSVYNCENTAELKGISVFGVAYNVYDIKNCRNSGTLRVEARDYYGSVSAAGVAMGGMRAAENCRNSGDILVTAPFGDTGYDYLFGGVFATVQHGDSSAEPLYFSRLYNSGNVTVNFSVVPEEPSSLYLGGICADAGAFTVFGECVNTGEIYISDLFVTDTEQSFVGGIAGKASVILNSYSSADITFGSINNSYDGALTLGGITGEGEAGYCYFAGNIDADELKGITVTAGAVCGMGSAENCFFIPFDTSLTVKSDATEKSGDALSRRATFDGWDFNKYWEFGGAGDYPFPNLRFMGSGKHLFTASFNSDGKEILREIKYYGNTVKLFTPEGKKGFTFAYWQDETATYKANEEITLYGDITLNAVWVKENGDGAWDGSISTSYSGNGTKESPYLISTPQQLAGINVLAENNPTLTGVYFKQTADIILNSPFEYGEFIEAENKWTPILQNSYTSNFLGGYDGGGYAISGMYIKINFNNTENTAYQTYGLFGSVDNAEISNIRLENAYVYAFGKKDGYGSFGGIAGKTGNAVLNNLSVQALIEADSVNAKCGGIAGQTEGTLTVNNCHNGGSVTGGTAGGIIGRATHYGSADLTVTGCTNSGDVYSTKPEGQAGGIIAYASVNGEYYLNISGCENSGTVTALNGQGGGVIGFVNRLKAQNLTNSGSVLGTGGIIAKCYDNAVVSDCTNTGSVTSQKGAGGIIGEGYSGTLLRLTNSGNITANGASGGIAGSFSGSIANCENSGEVLNSLGSTGGIAGFSGGEITHCKNLGRVSLKTQTQYTSNAVGGIMGKGNQAENCQNLASIIADFPGGGAGGILGCANSSGFNITGCINTGSVTHTGDNVGGIAGYTYGSGTVSGCLNTGKISGDDNVGGVLGRGSALKCANMGDISGNRYVGGVTANGDAGYCYNTGSVTAVTEYAGGVSAYGNEVYDSYNTGSVTASNYSGGIGGYLYYSADRCYNVGGVTIYKGLYQPICNSGTVSNCYYLSTAEYGAEISGSATPSLKGTSASGDTLKSTYLTGFDYSAVWQMSNTAANPYPLLRENPHAAYHTVTFTDSFGNDFGSQRVLSGLGCSAPAVAPFVKEGKVYTLTGWDTDYSSVDRNLTVKAVYNEAPIVYLNGKTFTLTLPVGYSYYCLKDTVERGYSSLVLTDTNGLPHAVGVTFNLQNYNPYEIGEYTFKGKLTGESGVLTVNGEAPTLRVILKADAPVFNSGDLTFTEENGCITVTGYTGAAEEIIIPAEINGKAVTKIGASAFSQNQNIRRVYLPSTVKEIGERAFYGCQSLVEINLNSTEKIGDSAFYSTALSGITLPGSVTEIGETAFGVYEEKRVQGFTVWGYSSSAGSLYAIEKGFTFKEITVGSFINGAVSLTVERESSLNAYKVQSGEQYQAALALMEKSDAFVFTVKGESGCTPFAQVIAPAGATDTAVLYKINGDGTAERVLFEKTNTAYTFTATSGTYALVWEKAYIEGDCNGDSLINGTDLALLKIYLAGASKAIGEGADINGDSAVNGTDLAILKLKLAGAM